MDVLFLELRVRLGVGKNSLEISEEKILVLGNRPRGSDKDPLLVKEPFGLFGFEAEAVVVNVKRLLFHVFIKRKG